MCPARGSRGSNRWRGATLGHTAGWCVFTGVVGQRLLDLTGSSRHVLGGQPSSHVDTDRERYAPGGSWARHMVESALAQDLSVTEGGQPNEAFQKDDGAAITAMLGLHRRLVGHPYPVEFVAKRRCTALLAQLRGPVQPGAVTCEFD